MHWLRAGVRALAVGFLCLHKRVRLFWLRLAWPSCLWVAAGAWPVRARLG